MAKRDKTEKLTGELWQEWAQSCMENAGRNGQSLQGYPTSEDLRMDGVSIYVFIPNSVTKEQRESMSREVRAGRDVVEFAFKVCPKSWFEKELLEEADQLWKKKEAA